MRTAFAGELAAGAAEGDEVAALAGAQLLQYGVAAPRVANAAAVRAAALAVLALRLRDVVPLRPRGGGGALWLRPRVGGEECGGKACQDTLDEDRLAGEAQPPQVPAAPG